MKQIAEGYLRKALNSMGDGFREGQWESIEAILKGHRVLVVQRTGWGKSMVYFLATRLLRDRGAGPTLLISPLLSLMRNQLEAAARIGVRARTINSANREDWESVRAEVSRNEIDVLAISPERLGNEEFCRDFLSILSGKIGLFVIDEAHCISDWGHDFRPDYRRIVRVLQTLPSHVPVLATTATANDRVVQDVEGQLGTGILVQRGPLVRRSLKLQNILLPSPAVRLAWLAHIIPTLPGSGIVYTLTQRDAERVSEWLCKNRIVARPYHSGLPDSHSGVSVKEDLEQKLIGNEIKVLVATVALGMGFDKPDLGFVIHYQRPSSVVHYYQQVGRAGRAVEDAYGILLCGEEDDAIADYFIRSAFPPQRHISEILKALGAAEKGHTIASLQSVVNLRKSQIEKTLKFLTVETPCPIAKTGSQWGLTAHGADYQVDREYVDAITSRRREEQKQMQAYMHHQGCLMEFLQEALDDDHLSPCGRCRNCQPDLLLSESYPAELESRANHFLRGSYEIFTPRKQWPAKEVFKVSPLSGYKIPDGLQPQEGRALCLWRDSLWGQMLEQGRTRDHRFSDELVAACVELVQSWKPHPPPRWVTCVPSLKQPELLPDFSARLAAALGLPFYVWIKKIRDNPPQSSMENSFQQVRNLDGVFEVVEQRPLAECLLIDDWIDSGWTMTVVSALLRQAGCLGVYPLALALKTPGVDG